MSVQGLQLKIKGHVQGVGYRWFALRAANHLGLVGWVMNNYDGSVLAKAEGERGMLEEFIKELKVGPMNGHVTDMEVLWVDPTGEFDGFEVRH